MTSPVNRVESPQPLPALDDPVVYIQHADVMPITIRKNYVRDCRHAAIIYLTDYGHTQDMLSRDRYSQEALLTRLQIIFGCTNSVPKHIDRALCTDDVHRR